MWGLKPPKNVIFGDVPIWARPEKGSFLGSKNAKNGHFLGTCENMVFDPRPVKRHFAKKQADGICPPVNQLYHRFALQQKKRNENTLNNNT